MKLRIFIFFLFCLFCTKIHSTIHHIKQDGTGDFTTIQEGINASVDTDTVLVYPGTYYENIDYLEKSLTVASLYMITPEDSLINQTIIDGNQQSRCVKIDECENASIIGFTIQNGSALLEGVSESYEGGGIFIKNTNNTTISFCKIRSNTSYYGGGIFVRNSITILKGNTISGNRAIVAGGGLLSAYVTDSIFQFDEINLNNIFLNYSGTGADIFLAYYNENTNVIIDTFTVLEPDYYFLNFNDAYTFSCLHAKIEQIDQDMFVSPNGNDENDGLSTQNPLQTIALAQTKIKRNDDNPNTLFLASGVYSQTLNNQIFPLNVKHGVIIQGISNEETILDAELEYPIFFQLSRYQPEFSKLILHDLKLMNGAKAENSFCGGITIYQADISLNNVIIENCNGGHGSAIYLSNGYSELRNTTIINNIGGYGMYQSVEFNCPNPIIEISLINTKIQNNFPDDDYCGGGLKFGGHINIPSDYYAQIVNCEFSGNHNNFFNPQSGLGGSTGLHLNDNMNVDIANCTFSQNTLEYNTGSIISISNSHLNLHNNILYNNYGYSMNIFDGAEVNVYYSLIEGGNTNVNYYGSGNVNWLAGNLDEDPMFDSLGIYPFALLNYSPCIDTGTLDLPAGIELPQFDLAGNPRICGDTVDMGAYEWQGVGIEEPEISQISSLTTHISNYPNPFNPDTTIKLELAESGKIELAIYNIKGQKVKTLLDCTTVPGTYECNWNGKDEMGKSVSSGQYVVKLKLNEKETTSKIMLLK